MNKVILHGRLVKDPDIRYTTTGKCVASFTVAVNRQFAREGEPKADYIPCVAWEKLAQLIADNMVKGKEILVEGRMQVRSYDAQDGSKRYVTEVILSGMDFCGSKGDRGNAPAGNTGGFAGEPVDDYSIPF
ncbi:single-strand DNA-binding protein [Anaerovibrio lipolyticus DSM 3074]|uniref:Single-stranded DNA-binding protein n=1 Tax=Anaerovibrio lipolyticus DSM 3074 TaxID=1120997 RepID=A0A1M6C5G0_9FIRM|nr:single-stranded DNA-binding protein [Anaerovibrio lipolyticus]SHI56256.1 single-strand DNA-binding protein [Anaerovibrio lipolyticus DSM 3074]